MAGGLQRAELHLRAETQLVPLAQRAEVELRPGPPPQVDTGAGPVAQLQVTGQEVGVEVGQHDVANVESLLPGILQVEFDVPLRVDDHGVPGLRVGDHVGGVCQAIEVVLSDKHLSLPLRRRVPCFIRLI